MESEIREKLEFYFAALDKEGGSDNVLSLFLSLAMEESFEGEEIAIYGEDETLESVFAIISEIIKNFQEGKKIQNNIPLNIMGAYKIDDFYHGQVAILNFMVTFFYWKRKKMGLIVVVDPKKDHIVSAKIEHKSLEKENIYIPTGYVST